METAEKAKRSHGDHHERQKHHHGGQKKKTGTLPLIMFLSMDEDSVLPGCPNASNPFHKCAAHCSQRIRSENGKKGNMKMVVEQRKPQATNCVHASNPFHVCAESCSKRTTLLQDGRAKGGGAAAQSERAVVIVKEKKDGVQVAERMVHPGCPNASNPFHVCVEACFPAKNKANRFDPLGSKVPIAKYAINVATKCKYASNPFHDCDEYCFESEPGKYRAKIRDQEKRKRAAKMDEKTAQSKLESTSEDRKTVDDVDQRTPEDPVQEDKSEDNHEDLKITEMNAQPERSDDAHELHHIYADYSSIQRKPAKDRAEEGRSKLYPSTSLVVFSDYIFVLVYIIHLIVIAIAYSKRK